MKISPELKYSGLILKWRNNAIAAILFEYANQIGCRSIEEGRTHAKVKSLKNGVTEISWDDKLLATILPPINQGIINKDLILKK